MKEDKRKDNGGARKGAGRPSKNDEAKVNTIFLTALKELYKKDTDDDSKVAFVKELLDSQRGQLFVAEHIFGKPKDIVENINMNYEAGVITKEEAEILNKVIDEKY